jgi:hypothetical protein
MWAVVHPESYQMTDAITGKSEFIWWLAMGQTVTSPQCEAWVYPSPVQVKFMVNKLELEKVYPQVFPISTMPPALHTHIYFIYHW